MRSASRVNGRRQRLATKPTESRARIGALPIRRATSVAASSAAAELSSPATTSTSSISAGGLKKCIPTTRSGSGVEAAIAVTESDEVLVASTVSGRVALGEGREQLPLQIQVLGRRLDHQIAAGQRLDLGTAPGEAIEGSSGVVLAPAPALGALGEPLAQPRDSILEGRCVGIVDHGLQPAEYRGLGDSGAHRPGADDPDSLELRHAPD